LLGAEVALLLLFFVLGVVFGPFPDSDVPLALLAGFAEVAAMALQNAVQRVHFPGTPPTTIMTSNTTQAVLHAVDLLRGGGSAQIKARFGTPFRSIAWFAAGCALAAGLYYLAGFWSLAVPVAVGAVIVLQSIRQNLEGGPQPQHTG